jgi:hypothetical protein
MPNDHQNVFLETALCNWKILERFDSNDQVKHMGLLFLQSRQSKQEDIVRNKGERNISKVSKGKE